MSKYSDDAPTRERMSDPHKVRKFKPTRKYRTRKSRFQ